MADGDPLRWFFALPPVTRAWFGLTVGLTASVAMDSVPPSRLTFDWDRIRDDRELWRLLTPFGYAGGPVTDFSTLILIWLIYVFSIGYERNPYDTGGGGTSSDAAFALLFCAAAILATYPLVNMCGPLLTSRPGHPILSPLFARNLAYAVMYLWSKRSPRVRADVNFIPVEGRNLPFAHLGISLFMGHRLGAMLHGIAVGHAFYWLVDVLPRIRGKGVLSTPRFLIDMFGEEEEEGEPGAPDGPVDVGGDGELPPPPGPPRGPPPGGAERRDEGRWGAPGRVRGPDDVMEPDDQ